MSLIVSLFTFSVSVYFLLSVFNYWPRQGIVVNIANLLVSACWGWLGLAVLFEGNMERPVGAILVSMFVLYFVEHRPRPKVR